MDTSSHAWRAEIPTKAPVYVCRRLLGLPSSHRQQNAPVDAERDTGQSPPMVALIWALFVGLVIGGGAAALSAYIGAGTALTYVLAVACGIVVGLVAGKPIWAKGARIEAGLKAVFGAAVAGFLLYALRRWGDISLDLSSLRLGEGSIGSNPLLSLPIVATALALMYEVDNMFGKDTADSPSKSEKAAAPRTKTKARVQNDAEEQPSEAKSDEGARARGKR